jgi:NADPH:quinone reductase-like Zn-dependent oxidoreductase
MMKAIVYEAYGSADVLRLAEVSRPAPADDEVPIAVRAVSLNGADREALIGSPLYTRIGGLRRPRHRILGSDIAGRVEAVGSNVRGFAAGDEVFGEMPGYHGGLAEYVTVPERAISPKPAALGFDEAACLAQAGAIALHGIRLEGRVQPGQKVLINGAGGAAGSFAVQLAKRCGAEVTAVDHTDKLAFLRELGADHVIDYTVQDFTRLGAEYDLVLDLIAHRSPRACARALKRGGTYFFVGGSLAVVFQILLLGRAIRMATGKRLRVLMVPQKKVDAQQVAALCTSGELRPVIDRRYPLSEAPAALRRLAEGRHRGKLVITVPG